MKFTPRGEFPRQRPLLASPLVLLSGEELIITAGGVVQPQLEPRHSGEGQPRLGLQVETPPWLRLWYMMRRPLTGAR